MPLLLASIQIKVDSPLFPFHTTDWAELPADIKEAFVALGYTEALWNADGEPESFECDFEELSQEQKEAALKIGYTSETWDAEE